ncbi:hypothetical protein [Corallococcus exiguus]|uniref:Uncharacterized protein n=1 Tax=Corallococcus exiguus TaxID=83462 RepID=A0A7X4YC19_9BACT|nr:hypothetical protein [Corallococcus exiguus]NBC41929.1 hypothetical protein [Corallococcus exiguus]TNV65329.1 hypothetical protein FH620_10055 [Corallococcus exiguus]
MLGGRGRQFATLTPGSFKAWLSLTAFCCAMVATNAVLAWGRLLIGGPVFWILWAVWLAGTVFYLGRRFWLIRVSRASTLDDIDLRLWECFQVLGLVTFAVSWGSGFTYHR